MESAPSSTTYQTVKPYLFSVAYRMTGSAADAEDLVQDAWIRYLTAGSPEVTSLRAYLTTTVSRLALDYLKSARVQRERYVGEWLPEPVLTADAQTPVDDEVQQRDAMSYALLLVMEALSPIQRVVYVMREGFGMAFGQIGAHLGKTPATCRQAFHRAQATLSSQNLPEATPTEQQRTVLDQLVKAIGMGDVPMLSALLADDVVWSGDGGPYRLTVQRPVVGSDRVSRGLAGIYRKVQDWAPAQFTIVDLNGSPAIVSRLGSNVDTVIQVDLRDGHIVAIRSQRNPDKLRFLARSLGLNVLQVDDRAAIHDRVRAQSRS